MTSDPANRLPYRPDGIITFLPSFESPDFELGHWETPESNEPIVLIAPYFSFSDTGRMFVQAAYDSGWVLAVFDWQSWVDTAEANRLCEDRSALEIASPDQLAKLLTMLVRSDRFSEGTLSEAFKSGLLTRILRRCQSLQAEMLG
jgi:hypothetical protein